GVLRFTVELQRDFVVGFGKLLYPDIDLNLDCRLGLCWSQGTGGVGILEGEVLDVLPQHIELRLCLSTGGSLRRAAIAGGGHWELPLTVLKTPQSRGG